MRKSWLLRILLFAIVTILSVPRAQAVTNGHDTVWTWGANFAGQLGDGTTTDKYIPVEVSGLTGTASVSGGGWHTIALKKDGTVWAWGNNASGQLGDGTYDGRTTPGQVSGLTGITAIATGNAHNIALKDDSTVWTWGNNWQGQLGDGTTTARLTPVQVNGLSGVVAISAGTYHSIALKNDGTVWAWGLNSSGQLGDSTTTARLTPVQVNGLSGVVDVSAGYYHSIAIKDDGTVWAWGLNNDGQLGDGTMTNRLIPIQVNSLDGVIAVSGGHYHSIALKNDGTVWAWGAGPAGDGSWTDRVTPVQVSGLTGVTAIAAAHYRSIALKSDGTVWAWGDNTYGSLGDGTTTNRLTPIQVSELVGVTAISAGQDHTIAVISNRPPHPNAGTDQLIECTGPSGASVILDGSGSSDPDGDPLTYTWTWAGGSAEGMNPAVQLPLGTTSIILTVSDGWATATDNVNITVQDTIPPVTTATGGSDSWFNTNVISTFTASDSGSGAKEIHYIIDGYETVAPGNYASVTVTTEGNHDIIYFAKDNADNPESPKRMYVKIDKTLPSGSVLIENNAPLTSTTSVALNLAASDNLSGVSQMRFSNDSVNWSDWETYSSNKSWTLVHVTDVMTVHAQFKDGAGNVSNIYSDDIFMDTDNDGWRDSQDCAPTDPSINPGAVEIVGNGVDDNCNGITVTSATYDDATRRLTVQATSSLGSSANLQLNSVNMTWNAGQSLWSKTLTGVTSNSATVSGSQGTDTILY